MSRARLVIVAIILALVCVWAVLVFRSPARDPHAGRVPERLREWYAAWNVNGKVRA